MKRDKQGEPTRSVARGNRKRYKIGYGKPPLHSRFQKGRSGNPAGRMKGVRNLATDVKLTLATPVKVTEGGRTRTKSTQESILMVMREKALGGDARAGERMMDYAARFNNDAAEIGAQQLSADDEAILAAYARDHAAAPKCSDIDKFTDDLAVRKRDTRSDKKPAK